MGQASKQESGAQASRVILASPRTLFRAFLDAETMAARRSFDGVEVAVGPFKTAVGSRYRARLRFPTPQASETGDKRVLDVAGEFMELAAEERIVESIQVLARDGRAATRVQVTTRFEPDRDGTRVTMQVAGAPEEIAAGTQAEVLASALRSLALLTE